MPIDRTAKTALDANLVNGQTSDAPKIKANNDALYNNADALEAAQNAHALAAVLPHADGCVTTAKLKDYAVTSIKIADNAVTPSKIPNASLTFDKFVPSALKNETQNALRLDEHDAQLADIEINVKNPPAPLVAAVEGADITSVVSACLAHAVSTAKTKIVYIPGGSYIFKSVSFPANAHGVKLIGAGIGLTKLISPAGRWGFSITANDLDNITVANMTIDNNLASIEGGLWFGGVNRGLVENVEFLNGDLSSMSISGPGISGGTRIGYDTIVRNCYAKGQKRYEPGGTSPFIAGNGATRTVFQNCIAEDCEADPFDSDNAPDTRFVNCQAIKNGAMSTFCAFWSEGAEQTTHVTWENCVAINFAIGFGYSESVIPHNYNPTIRNCEKAIWARSDGHVSGGVIENCGNNAVAETTGAVLFEQAGVLEGVEFKGTTSSYCFQNYNGAALLVNRTLEITGCKFDKVVGIGYGNTGAKHVLVNGNRFANTSLGYFNCSLKYLTIGAGNVFENSIIYGSRIGQSIITGSIFYTTDNTKTAIQLNLDTFNTYINDNIFDGFGYVTNSGTLGKNIYKNIVNKPNEFAYVSKNTITITTGGTYYPIPYTDSRGAYLIVVEGGEPDSGGGVYIVLSTTFTVDHTVYVVQEKPDYLTTNKFIIQHASGAGVTITHPVSGRTAKVTVLGFQ